MPDLVKVGYTLKDPKLRAEELNNTGAPHPYTVQYEILVENPRDLEQKTHRELYSRLESKEWFRCSVEQAVLAIKQLIGTHFVTETLYFVDQNELDALHEKLQRDLKKTDIVESHKRQHEEIQSRVNTITSRSQMVYNSLIQTASEKYLADKEKRFPDYSFAQYLAASTVICVALLSLNNINEFVNWNSWLLGGLISLLLGSHLLKVGHIGYRNKSRAYVDFTQAHHGEIELLKARHEETIVSLGKQAEVEHNNLRWVLHNCLVCKKTIRLERVTVLLHKAGVLQGIWRCPACKASIDVAAIAT